MADIKDKHVNRTTSGRFFKPFSEYIDSESLSCYYTRMYHEGAGSVYPISICMGNDDLTIYWHGTQKRHENEIYDYSVNKIFSISFSQFHKASFEKWLNRENLINDSPLGTFSHYNIDIKRDISGNFPFSFFDVFDVEINTAFAKNSAESYNSAKINNNKIDPFPISVKLFFLDLLFDLRYSNVFKDHPKYQDLLDFFESVNLSKAILYKAEYLLAKKEYFNLSDKFNKTKDNKIKEQCDFYKERYESYSVRWVQYLRTLEGEKALNNASWFSGVENEHNNIYNIKELNHHPNLRKEAEDSLQWALGRYNLFTAYKYQINIIYSKYSKVFFMLVAIILSLVLIFVFFNQFDSGSIGNLFLYHPLFSVLTISTIISIGSVISLFIFERFIYHFIFRNIFNLEREYNWTDTLASYPKILAIIKPKILIASGAVWTFIFNSDISTLWDLEFNLEITHWLFIIFILIITFIFSAGKINNYIKGTTQKKADNQKDISVILLIAVFFLVITAIVFIIFWINKHHIKFLYGFYLALISTTVIILYRIYRSMEKFHRITKRSLFLMFIATIYSFTIGLIGMSITGEKHFSSDDKLENYFISLYKKTYYNQTRTTDICPINIKDSLKLNMPSDTSIFLDLDKLTSLVTTPCPSDDSFAIKDTLKTQLFNKALPHFHRKISATHNKPVCFMISGNSLYRSLPDSLYIFAVIDPLIFFTFITVAIGLLLEMGLKIEETPNIEYE